MFIESSAETVDGHYVLNQLQKFLDVDKDICGRPKSTNAPEKKYLHSTILQLMSAELIVLNCSVENPKATFSLGITGKTPSHMIESKW